MVYVHPQLLDLQVGGIPEADAVAVKHQATIYPRHQNTIVLARRIELHVLLDRIPAIQLQRCGPALAPLPDLAIFTLMIRLVT